MSEDAASLLASNAFVSGLHSKIVPVILEDGIFWSRYFYKWVDWVQGEASLCWHREGA